MAAQPSHKSPRRLLTGAGVGAAAVLLAAATAAPALANGNHYGQSKEHSNNGHSSDQPSSNGQGSSTDNSSSSDPAGNNGTVFIHDVPGDQSPHNVPHVGCTFYVDFFGFDEGQNVTMSFAGQAPTGKDTPLGGSQTLSPVSSDSAGGAGNDWDNEITVTADDLGVTALGDPAHEGYHIKMTVVTNEPGDHKYKVFWLQPCTESSTTESGTTDTGTTETGTTQTGATPTSTDVGAVSVGQQLGAIETSKTGQSSAAATTAGASSPKSASKVPTEVLGRSITRSGSAPGAAPAAGSLPFTGLEIGGFAAAAALLLGSGSLMIGAARRRKRA